MITSNRKHAVLEETLDEHSDEEIAKALNRIKKKRKYKRAKKKTRKKHPVKKQVPPQKKEESQRIEDVTIETLTTRAELNEEGDQLKAIEGDSIEQDKEFSEGGCRGPY